MLLADLDLFDTYRWLLAIVCTIYAAVVTWQSLWGWLQWFASSRQTAIVGRYTSLLLVRLRVRRFGWELLQIIVLLVAFFYVVHLHYRLKVMM